MTNQNAFAVAYSIRTIKKWRNLPNIYFVGKAGTGKSTCANFLIWKYDYQIAKFAYPVYMIAEKYFSMQKKDRKLLQVIGTDAGRCMIDEDIWVKRFQEDMLIVQKTAQLLRKPLPKLVMDDCRFINEHEILKKIGFIGIYIDVPDEIRKERLIQRDGTAQEKTLNHISEQMIDNFKNELIQLDGSGSLEDTYLRLNGILKELVEKQGE